MSKKKKKAPEQSAMQDSDVRYRQRLLDKWGHQCLICGREFANLACVTKEHIIPKSNKEHDKGEENIAPTHYRCNQLRGTDSIIATGKIIDAVSTTMSYFKFEEWLNTPVPNRAVPPMAMRKPVAPYWPRASSRSFELPEHLPGMS